MKQTRDSTCHVYSFGNHTIYLPWQKKHTNKQTVDVGVLFSVALAPHLDRSKTDATEDPMVFDTC